MFPFFEAFAEMVREQTKVYAQAQDRVYSRHVTAALGPLRLMAAIRSPYLEAAVVPATLPRAPFPGQGRSRRAKSEVIKKVPG